MKDPSLPWTTGGKALLKKINQIVEENGGLAAMHDMVNAEINQSTFWIEKSREQEVYRITLRHNIPYRQACNLIPMPIHMFSRKIAEYKLINNINP